MKLAVEGMACLGSFGDYSKALHDTLELCAPSGREVNSKQVCGAKADTSRLHSYFAARTLRQMDHFTRMALLCACDALTDAGLAPTEEAQATPPDMGIVLVSGYGPANCTFQFLDSIMEHGELMASPLSFSHSVHNIPAANVALKLRITGPCLSLCQLECPVTAGLLAASAWLAEGRVSRVLFGAVDEHTPLLAQVSGRLAENLRKQGKPAGQSDFFLGEGAAFFVLGAAQEHARRGFFSRVSMQATTEWLNRAEQESEDAPARTLLSGRLPGVWAARRNSMWLKARYGNIPVAQALDAAFALSAGPFAGEIHCVAFGPQTQTGSFSVESFRQQHS